jgi:ribose 5-phosphate isomerase B
MEKRVAVGADHAGFALKEDLKGYLKEQGYEVLDVGTDALESVDYPDFAAAVAEAVAAGEVPWGLLICGTGIGMAIAANKVAGVRAACCGDPFSARMARAHNDANVLTMGGRVVGVGLAREILQAWLASAFEGGRHARRTAKVRALEERTSGGTAERRPAPGRPGPARSGRRRG